jgi:hypothetical protein
MQATISSVLAWTDSHQAILIPIAVVCLQQLASLCNGNVKFSFEGKLINVILDIISNTTNKNSPNTFKIPGYRSQAPAVVSSVLPK